MTASDPIVPFRETIVVPPEIDMVNEAIEKVVDTEDSDSAVDMQTSNKQSRISIKAIPLPQDVIKLLEENSDIFKAMDKQKGLLTKSTLEEVDKLKQELTQKLKNCDLLNDVSSR